LRRPVVYIKAAFFYWCKDYRNTRIIEILDTRGDVWYKSLVENGFQYQFMLKKAHAQLMDYLAGQGLRFTSQRGIILAIFVQAGQHVSAEELYVRVKKDHLGIGYATVYRTLKLLAESGLAEARRFDDGVTRFEYNAANDHHDHLICTQCGAVIEFENERIEALQQDVARRKDFRVQSHKLELYGQCAGCSEKSALDRNRK
jgi:Fur family ferric uptake transcriptional regulator